MAKLVLSISLILGMFTYPCHHSARSPAWGLGGRFCKPQAQTHLAHLPTDQHASSVFRKQRRIPKHTASSTAEINLNFLQHFPHLLVSNKLTIKGAHFSSSPASSFMLDGCPCRKSLISSQGMKYTTNGVTREHNTITEHENHNKTLKKTLTHDYVIFVLSW